MLLLLRGGCGDSGPANEATDDGLVDRDASLVSMCVHVLCVCICAGNTVDGRTGSD